VVTSANSRRRAAIALALWVVGVGATAVAAMLQRSNWTSRWLGNPWTLSNTITLAAAVFSCLSLVSAGAWLGWRLERNAIGWWLNAAGIAFALWIAALFWPNRAGTWIALLLPVTFRVLVVMAVLAWPTGRFERRWRGPLFAALATYAAFGVLTAFLGATPDSVPPWGHNAWLLPFIGGQEVGALRQAVLGIVYGAVAPTAFIVAVARRRVRLPLALRAVSAPAYAAAWVLVIGDYWLFVSSTLGAQLEQLNNGSTTVLGTIRGVVDYGRFGVVPLLLLVGARARRRIVDRNERAPGRVDIGDVTGSPSVDNEIQALLGLEAARVVFVGPAGEWVGAGGSPVTDDPRRRSVPFSDLDGHTVAALELPSDVSVAPTAVEAVAATVRVDLVRARRTAEAAARLTELRDLQRLVLDRQDAARRRLERDLHDGVQQRLVALSLDAALAERQIDRAGNDNSDNEAAPLRLELVDALETTMDDVRHLVDHERPAVLDAGLAAALAALAASVSLPTELVLRGDLDVEDPMARVLWFAASEAVGNALKHADAQRLRIDLHVGDEQTRLRVSDDGRGGVTDVPRSIAERLESSRGTVAVSSPGGGGTVVTIEVPASDLVTA
jgi:signal transduction histidine kinase